MSDHSDNMIAAKQSGAFAALQEELAGAGRIGLGRLRAIWIMCRGQAECPAEIHRALGDRMLKQGEAILAYDVLSQGLTAAEREAQSHAAVRIRQLLALALAQTGAAERAGEILTKLQDEGFATPETLGLYGRVCKDLAQRPGTFEERAAWLERSYQSYDAGFEKAEAALHAQGGEADPGDAIYCGINAAAVGVLAGQRAAAQVRAARVHALCSAAVQQAQATGGKADYWTMAALAEAELIRGNLPQAQAAYRRALPLAEGSWRELSSTRRQARLLTQALGLDPGFLKGLFPPLGIAVFAAPPGTPSGEAKAELRASLDAAGIVAGYATACSPADLVFIETMLETGREINVILPCPRAECRVLFAGSWWERQERVLSKVNAVTEDTQLGCMNQGVNMEFARLRALGAGMLRAQGLDAELHVWGQVAGGEAALTKEERNIPPLAATPNQETYAIRAMLFGDVKGYSKLNDVELLQFARQYERHVAEVLARFPGEILSRRTAGDGIFLVFANMRAAADVALALRDMVASTRWDACGLPAHLGIRISLDAGPVYGYQDPITGQPEVCGLYVNRAARIEPITPPNQVYASEAFAALHVATCAEQLRFDYVGQTQLPKGFGWAPLYGCQARRENQEC